LEIRFVYHLQVVTTNNYNTIANFHILQITRAHTKSFQSAFASRFPVTDLNNGGSSTAPSKSSFHRLPYNRLTSKLVAIITSRHGPRRKRRSFLYSKRFSGNVFVPRSLPSNSYVYLLIKSLLPSSGCCFVVCFEVITQ
jgi:hypothetical protein